MPDYDQFRTLFIDFYDVYFLVTLPFFIAANLFYFVILFAGFLNSRRQYINRILNMTSRLTPMRSLLPISILIPSYNEELTAPHSVRSMLKVDYPEFEVIICNDGSKDGTLQALLEEFEAFEIVGDVPKSLPTKKLRAIYRSKRYPNLTIIDKDNGGKSDALNACINFSKYPLICCVDSDSVIEPGGLARVSMPFLEDDTTIATGGTILLANPDGEKVDPTKDYDASVPNTWIGMVQCVEYIRAFLVGRLGWDYLKTTTIISGAFGLFRKSIVVKSGGYSVNTIGEDMELLLRMQSRCIDHKIPYNIRLLPDPVCWTEPPSDIKTLGNQRRRWSQGLAECLFRHKKMLFNPKAGSLGMVALPYQFFFELVSAPVEIFGYLVIIIGLAIDVFDPPVVTAFFALTILTGCVLNFFAIAIDQMTFLKYNRFKDLSKLLLAAVLEHLGFRQFHLIWRMQGFIAWLRGKHAWGEMKRTGIKKDAKARI